ncbi:DUF882 domain-containing protein [Neorhizobium sp. NCHU2750]|uniref:DUF882 domain-containing protein n=1 Tax=Neorhizobium sp. NCHU2750 TaxID=1825976 RepID=UPI001FE023F9
MTAIGRSLSRASRTIALTVAALAGSAIGAEAEDRALKLYFTHTGERATITYKRDGRFDAQGLAKINRFLRDWRKNEATRMDPRLLDLVFEVYERSGARDYIHVVSAYRSPGTNAMLRGRSRSSGVAKKSQHTLGKAMDFYIPGVKLSTLRQMAMQMQVGGVGFYPTSGSPFVHLDVGNVRAWPRMSRKELARIFPHGKTMHLPASGSPLPGYAEAVADYKRRVGSKSIEIAGTLPDDDDDSGSGARAAKRPASGVIAAMLPTPKSRAAEALATLAPPQPAAAELTPPPPASRPAATPETANDYGFADLAKLAAPLPGSRPQTPADVDPVRTASLGPLEEKTDVAPAIISTAVAPAFLKTAQQQHPAAGRELRMPKGSLALLPITGPDLDVEDEFDGEDAVLEWALSAPGEAGGMAAPVLVGRTLTDLTAKTSRSSPLPFGVDEEFDHDRFWSGG